MKKNASSFFSLNPLLAAAKRTALAALLFAPLAARSDTTVFNDTFNNGSTINSATPASPTASSTAYEVLANKGAGTGTALAANRLSFSCAGSASSALVEVQALFSQSPVVLNQPGDTLQLTVTFTNGYALTTPNSGQLQFGLYNSGQVKPYPGGGNILSSTTTAYNGYAQGWLGYVAVVKTNNGLNAISMRPSQPGNAGRNQDLTAGGATSSGYTNGTTVGSATSTLASTLTSGAVYTNVVTITMYGGDTNSLAITNSLYSNTGTLLTQYGCVATNANYVTNSFDSLAIGYYGVEAATAVMNISKISVTASITGSPGPLFTVSGGGIGCIGSTAPAVTLSGSATTNAYFLLTNGVVIGTPVTGSGSPVSFPAETVVSVVLTNTVLASNTVSGFTGLMTGNALVSPISAPTITTQPSAVTVATNNIGVFVVVATGNSLGYQWYKNGVKLSDAGHIAGSGSATLVVSPATTADATTGTQGYYCAVTNTCGATTYSATNNLVLDAGANIVWQGGNPTNNWDLATSLNFTNSAGTAVKFNSGDNVTLDDSSVYPVINVVGSYVSPNLITENAVQNYSITAGSGAITGPGALVMSGSGILTVSNANTFTGGTTISSGTVKAQNYNGLGTGTVTLSGGTLEFPIIGGSTTGLSNSINVTANSTIQYDLIHTYGAVIYGGISGNSGSTLTIYLYNANTGNSRFRLYGNFTNNANIYLSSLGATVDMAPNQAVGLNQVFNGIISGSGRIVARNAGNAILNQTNSFNDSVSGYSLLMSQGNVGFGADSISSSPPTIDASPAGTGIIAINSAGSEGGDCSFFASGGAHNVGNPILFTSATNTMTLNITGSNALTLSGGIQLAAAADVNGTNRIINIASGAAAILSGIISDNSHPSGIVKKGTGPLYLNGVNNYTGDTTNTAGLLAGIGTIAGNVTIDSGASLGGGDNTGIGTLNIGGSLTLNGNAYIRLNKSLSPQSNDMVAVTGSLTNSGTGTLTVTNSGVPALAIGDSFQIFSGAVSNGAAITVTGGGMNWNNNLAIDGSIQALSVASSLASYSTNITASVINGGTTLNVKWPATHLGWELMMQTNTLANGLGKIWTTNYGTANVTSTNLPINPNNGSVFYKLVHP